MKQPQFALGDLVKIQDNDIDHKTIVGYVVGLKLEDFNEYDEKTKTKTQVKRYLYRLSGHEDSWYYDHAVKGVK